MLCSSAPKYEYTLIHILWKLLFTEALLNSLDKLLAKAGLHLGCPRHAGVELSRAEKVAQLEENMKGTGMDQRFKVLPLVIPSLICVVALFAGPFTFSLGEESTSSADKRVR